MKVLERRIIYKDNGYVAFPNIAYIGEGKLACFFRHAKDRRAELGRYTHIDDTAKDVYVVSRDDGLTFDPELHVVLNDGMSEQDPCVTVLPNGRSIVSYFRWRLVPLGDGSKTFGEELFKAYGRTVEGFYDAYNIGFSLSISDDEGETWRQTELILPDGFVPGSAVRGNITRLECGTLLLPFYGCLNVGDLASCGVMESRDDGETWTLRSRVVGDADKNYLEPNLYLAPSGELFMLMRTQTDFKKPNIKFDETYLPLHIARSNDMGRTFTKPEAVESVLGSNPFHVLSLGGGKAFLHYGYRREKYSIRGKVVRDDLSDIETAPEIVIRDGIPTADLGYTHAATLANGDIMVVYYLSNENGDRFIEGTVLRV